MQPIQYWLALSRRILLNPSRFWTSTQLFCWQREFQRRHTVARRARVMAAQQSRSCRVLLCRVIGNDLPPRHQPGQALANLRTILEDEANPCGWRKLFLLNRIVDKRLESQAVEAICKAGHDYRVIPFEPGIYQSLRYRPELFGGLAYFSSPQFRAKHSFAQDRERIWACADKIRYLMNVNGARNLGLASGHATSDWTIVLDGSCFLSDAAFAGLQRDMLSSPSAAYLIVPMTRLHADHHLTPHLDRPAVQEEPQIGFRSDAVELFDESYPYGLRDKTSLLHRLGVPGPWCGWDRLDFYPGLAARSPDRHFYRYASASVLRLRSGRSTSHLRQDCIQPSRYRARITAVFRMLQLVDSQLSVDDADVLDAIAP